MAMGDGPQNEVNVLESDEEVRLNLPALAKVLCQEDTVDTPLAVIGIAGPTRSGKSFLMSYLMRYLRNEGWIDQNWIGDDDTLLNDGFGWTGGVDPHTKGMRIWKQVFKIPDDNGEQIPILLVDTQGLYDEEMTKEDNTKLFTLTMLLCSHLMLNIEKRVNERELESLELFTQYAREIQRRESTNESPISKSFQTLTFLVRDWQDSEEFSFGAEGGDLYLKQRMRPTRNREANFVRENIDQTFRKCGGFLMPYPGTAVGSKTFVGKNADVDPKFRNFVGELANSIFHPNNLEARIYDGKLLTGRQLYLLLEACGTTFQSGKTPKVENMWSMRSRMQARIACDEEFERLEKAFKEAIKNNKNPETTYSTLLFEALERFKASLSFIRDDMKEEYRERLIMKCQNFYHNETMADEFRKKRAENMSLQVVHELNIDYKQYMCEMIKYEAKSDEKLDSLHKKYLRKAEEEYGRKVLKDAAWSIDHVNELKTLIALSYEKYKKMNARRQNLEVLGEVIHSGDSTEENGLKGQYDASLLLIEIMNQYSEELQKFAPLYVDEKNLEKQIMDFQSQYANLFEECWNEKWPQIHTFRDELLSFLGDEFKDCMECNERNKAMSLKIVEESVSRAKAIYSETFSKALDKGYCPPDKLKEMHEKTVETLKQQLRAETGGVNGALTDPMELELQSYMENEHSRFCGINKKNKRDSPPMSSGVDICDILKDAGTAVGGASTYITLVQATLNKIKKTTDVASSFAGKPNPSVVQIVFIGSVVAVGVGVLGFCIYKYVERRKKAAEEKRQLEN